MDLRRNAVEGGLQSWEPTAHVEYKDKVPGPDNKKRANWQRSEISSEGQRARRTLSVHRETQI